MRLFLLPFFLLFSFNSFAQTKIYNFNVIEGKSSLFTMNQSNDLVLNSYRIFANELNLKQLSPRKKTYYIYGSILFTGLLGQALTHEEGHRSVLTELGIGSINKPFLDKNGVAKVTGVTNETLINLRNTDLPNYIRLHTGGLESDYAYLKKEDALFYFNEEEYQLLWGDYVARKFSVQMYLLSTLLKSKVGIKESEEIEIKRDIVGHDIFGMIRHLHRPNMDFYRYTEYEELTTDEKQFAKRIGYSSLLNLINPAMWRQKNFNVTENIKGNFSVNYSLSPFGDFAEQNFYLVLKNKYKINPYFRQYFNKSYTFLAGGLNLQNLSFNNEKFLLNTSLDYWSQPKNLDFRTKESDLGFGIKSNLGIRFTSWNNNNKNAYFNFGAAFKTAGFIPENPSLKKDFRLNLGFILTSK